MLALFHTFMLLIHIDKQTQAIKRCFFKSYLCIGVFQNTSTILSHFKTCVCYRNITINYQVF